MYKISISTYLKHVVQDANDLFWFLNFCLEGAFASSTACKYENMSNIWIVCQIWLHLNQSTAKIENAVCVLMRATNNEADSLRMLWKHVSCRSCFVSLCSFCFCYKFFRRCAHDWHCFICNWKIKKEKKKKERKKMKKI